MVRSHRACMRLRGHMAGVEWVYWYDSVEMRLVEMLFGAGMRLGKDTYPRSLSLLTCYWVVWWLCDKRKNKLRPDLHDPTLVVSVPCSRAQSQSLRPATVWRHNPTVMQDLSAEGRMCKSLPRTNFSNLPFGQWGLSLTTWDACVFDCIWLRIGGGKDLEMEHPAWAKSEMITR